MKSTHQPVIWITGASKGIGAAIAGAFATLDCIVVLSGRNKTLLEQKVKALNEHGGNAVAVLCDVTHEKSVAQAYKKISKKLGGVDVLINNAGVTTFKLFEDSTLKDFDLLVNTNLRGYFLCISSVLPEMLNKKSGHIINIHSVAAVNTFLKSSIYSAAKAGALAMTRCLRAEVRKSGIRIIDVLPGAVETDMWHEGTRKKYHEKMLQPEDVAEIVLSLYTQPHRATTDEIIIRPVEGDL